MSSHQYYAPVEGSHRSESRHSSRSGRESFELEERPHSPSESTAQLTNNNKQNNVTSNHAPPSDSRIFDPSHQTRKLFIPQFLRWLLTVFIVIALIATLKFYENKGSFAKDQKYTFNTVFTLLSLGLGLNFFEAFKEIAKVLRWNILASKDHSVREVDLILSIDSLTKVVVLGWEYRWKLLTLLVCLLWLFLNLIAQGAVALINLTYSVDGGYDWKGTYTQQGVVGASNMGCFTSDRNCSKLPEVQQIVAHLYGEMAQSSECCTYNDISEVYNSDANCIRYCKPTRNHQEYAYRFSEINPDDFVRAYPRFTDRVITASSGECYQYDIDRDNNGEKVKDLNGNLAANKWKYSNGTTNGSLVLPMAYSAIDSTTYIYRGTKIPQEATTNACGPRCMWMWAFRAWSTNPVDEGQRMAVFQCPITISTVSNVHNDTQKVPDSVARIAASAIALQGRFAVQPDGSVGHPF